MPSSSALRRPASNPSAHLAVFAPEVDRLAALGTQRRYRKNTVLIEEGDSGDSIYIVVSGQLRAYVSDSRGREVTLGLHGPGESET